jgi:hypothetical protein
VRDLVDLEASGIPGVLVASLPFIHAAAVQSRALGAEPVRVFVPHPIQNRSDAEMATLAAASFAEILAGLSGS